MKYRSTTFMSQSNWSPRRSDGHQNTGSNYKKLAEDINYFLYCADRLTILMFSNVLDLCSCFINTAFAYFKPCCVNQEPKQDVGSQVWNCGDTLGCRAEPDKNMENVGTLTTVGS